MKDFASGTERLKGKASKILMYPNRTR